MTETAYLSLGSNLGDREKNLAEATRCLASLGTITARSYLYETEPVDVATDQPWYLNCAIALQTELTPEKLLQSALEIERGMGRERTGPKEPRTIDIDILLYGEREMTLPGLTIPHPAMHERRFVLEPLAQIAPDMRHPRLMKTIRELRDALPSAKGEVHRLAKLAPDTMR